MLEHGEDIDPIYIRSLERAIEYIRYRKAKKQKESFDSFCFLLDDEDFPLILSILEETKSKIISVSKNSKVKNKIGYFNSNFFLRF